MTPVPATNAPGQSLDLLLEVTEHLHGVGISYVVVGAVAAAIHGMVRSTLDADALVSVSVMTLAEVGKTFERRGYQTELRRGDDSDPIPAMLVIADSFGNRVDLLGGLRGMDAAIFSRAVAVPFRNATLQLASGEDIVAMKCFANGPQDLIDAKQLLQVANAEFDMELVRRLVRRFGRVAADNLEKLLVG